MAAKHCSTASLGGNQIADGRIAEALLDAIGGWAEWCNRRVDSVHPQEGERGRVRHSIDCVPPPDPALAYLSEERSAKNVTDVRGQVIVPLAIVKKQPMRELDATDSDGRPVALLGAAENRQLAAAMLKYALEQEHVRISDSLGALLLHIVGPGDRDSAPPKEVAESLVINGSWDGSQYWEPGVVAPEICDLIRDFAEGFLLAGLLPADRLGIRQVVKVSFHWRIEPAEGSFVSLRNRILVSIRAVDRSIELPMTAPSDADSYHLEFQTPLQLDCIRLDLPKSGLRGEVGASDTTGQPVAHAHGRYEMPPDGGARAHLVVPRRGLWTYAVLATTITVATLWLGLLLPGGMEALKAAGEGATAVLLALPAVVIGMAAGRRENALAAWMLGPLRVVMLVCSLMLLALGWALVGKLQEPWHSWLWVSASLLAALLLAGVAVVGPLMGRRWRRVAGKPTTGDTLSTERASGGVG